jgi:hypothetical protein
MRFVGWVLLVAVVVGILALNASRSHVSAPSYPAPASYSVGTVCFDDGAGGISNPEECLP